MKLFKVPTGIKYSTKIQRHYSATGVAYWEEKYGTTQKEVVYDLEEMVVDPIGKVTNIQFCLDNGLVESQIKDMQEKGYAAFQTGSDVFPIIAFEYNKLEIL